MAPYPRIEEKLVPVLKVRRALVATVESCTGGLVASRLTDVANSSHAFWGGWVAYQNPAKIALLGLKPEKIKKDGAVSQATAVQLAEAGLARMRESGAEADLHLCVATTGVAGPKAGDRGEPPGTCFIALASTGHPTRVVALRPRDGRETRAELKERFATEALQLLESALPL